MRSRLFTAHQDSDWLGDLLKGIDASAIQSKFLFSPGYFHGAGILSTSIS